MYMTLCNNKAIIIIRLKTTMLFLDGQHNFNVMTISSFDIPTTSTTRHCNNVGFGRRHDFNVMTSLSNILTTSMTLVILTSDFGCQHDFNVKTRSVFRRLYNVDDTTL